MEGNLMDVNKYWSINLRLIKQAYLHLIFEEYLETYPILFFPKTTRVKYAN